MARYMAIGDAPGITEEGFRGALGEIRKWRFDRRGWIIKAYCNVDQGKIVAECEASDQQQFESWLAKTGWKINGVYRVNYIHEAAAIWPV